MLVLTRKKGQSIFLGEEFKMTYKEHNSESVVMVVTSLALKNNKPEFSRRYNLSLTDIRSCFNITPEITIHLTEFKGNSVRLGLDAPKDCIISREELRNGTVYGGKVFVFGSNQSGIHGAGAALSAAREHGAVPGVGEGFSGNSYAIPTKNYAIQSRSLEDIQDSVNTFLDYAEDNPDKSFYITKIGCGLAGYSSEDIGPMFVGAPRNCQLPSGWGY